MSADNTLLLCNAVFMKQHFHPYFSCLEVLRAMRIHNLVCVRTLCSLVHGYEWFRGAWLVSSQGHLKLEAVRLDWNFSTPIWLHDPITCNAGILNLNILHFPCIVWLFITTQLHVLGNKCLSLLCILYFMWLYLHLGI